ncbi:transcription initiation protein SPT3 homolog isoform X3 [Zootermopsis nevadensis]|uniref:Transcription initiation protein SPT3-like protein n=1 Tax=Zootermopsis nevadensis TaxID=136037 RepID=A0A067RI08_ZOONE|nr:transcription initiation protein SPT3 homolog isoform X3 [Zootermopsis nevadensis]KDR18882.1 Transcription initiation protein SPT3-like protein [Zootermopsis nevadensis]
MTSIIHSSEGESGCDQPIISKGLPVAGSFVTEIQSMMHGFGDARSPLPESASLIESIVQQQQRAVISQAADMATMRGSKCIGPEDILFLLRKDRIKMHRLMKYLAVKDMKKNINSVLLESSLDGDLMLETPRGSGKKQTNLCMDFLRSIDQTGELTDTCTLPVDMVKHERNVRAERSSRVLDETRYLEFVNARRASFVSLKSASKFRELLQTSSDGNFEALKLSGVTYDLLGYMAYETVAQIVDLALLVRRDSLTRPGMPFSRYIPGAGYSTSHTLDSQQIEFADPLTPAEIREALRRYCSCYIGPGAVFTCSAASHARTRLLSC